MTRPAARLLTVLISVPAMLGLGLGLGLGLSVAFAAPGDTTGPTVSYDHSLHLVSGQQLRPGSSPTTGFQAVWTQNDPSGICNESGCTCDDTMALEIQSFTLVASQIFLAPTNHDYDIDITETDCSPNHITSNTHHHFGTTIIDQEGAASFSPGWMAGSCTCFSGGRDMHSSKVGASASFVYSGDAVGFVTEYNKNRGTAEIFVDGVDEDC